VYRFNHESPLWPNRFVSRKITTAAARQSDQPDDFVVASGVDNSLEELVATTFAAVGLNWRDLDYDSSLVRSSEIMCSLGDPSKAAQVVHWRLP
jgi:GDPmannose 4,6-dehydratase